MGLKTWLETGGLLTTPGSLMYATPVPANRKRSDRDGCRPSVVAFATGGHPVT